MSSLSPDIRTVINHVQALLANPDQAVNCSAPGNTFFMKDGSILALPREQGDSRYPYGADGFNFWAYASGSMHANDGLFSWFLRAAEGQEPPIAFFAAMPDGDNFRPLPLLGTPYSPFEDHNNIRRYTVFTPHAVYYMTHCDQYHFGLRVFISPKQQVCFTLLASHMGDASHRLLLSSFFNPYLRHEIHGGDEDKWFKEISLVEPPSQSNGLPPFLVKVNEDQSRTKSITHYGLLRRHALYAGEAQITRHQATTSRLQYIGGSRSSLHTPVSLIDGAIHHPRHVCSFTETAVAADLLDIELPDQSEIRLDYVFELPSNEPATNKLISTPLDIDTLDNAHAQLRDQDRQVNQALSMQLDSSTSETLSPEVFNTFFTHLMKQVEFCSLIKGYVQLSPNSLIGIRDVFQALEGLMFWQPEAARAKMMEALDYTAPDGRCFRQYSLPNGQQCGRMDLRPFIDQGVWVISTIWTYLKLTGDWSLLEETCGYHRIVDESAGQVEACEERDSVITHLVRILDYLLNQQDPETHCIHALYGDWNDALDGLGVSQDPHKKYGSGVSVMATLQVYQNTDEMIRMLKQVNETAYQATINRYQRHRELLEKGLLEYAIVTNDRNEARILHGWGDERSYLVGSYQDPDNQARDGLTSNAFWVLSGMLEKHPKHLDTILAAYQRLDSKYGLKTFEPGFAPNTPGVGRIPKLPIGTAENAGAYIHATAFAIMSLFQAGKPHEAWDQLIKILPFTPGHDNLSHSPFVMPNSYGYNPDRLIDGQNMNDWQTGSSNVVLKLLIRNVFGFEPEIDGIRIQPAGNGPFREKSIALNWRGIPITIKHQHTGDATRTFTVNGKDLPGEQNTLMGIDTLHIPANEIPESGLEIIVTDT
jgi:cellobiose phosphorylase